MEKEEQLFKKRIQELAENAYSRDIPLHTDFLTLAEQTVFQNMSATLPPVKFVLSGGFPMSERKVLCFLASYEEELYAPPFVCLKIAPANRRFAEELTHRDYLGAIMNLGIDRRYCSAGGECLGFCHGKDEQIPCGEPHDDPAHFCYHRDHVGFFGSPGTGDGGGFRNGELGPPGLGRRTVRETFQDKGSSLY